MDRARESRAFLELNVLEANAIGRRFYDAYGFEFVDRTWVKRRANPSCGSDSADLSATRIPTKQPADCSNSGSTYARGRARG